MKNIQDASLANLKYSAIKKVLAQDSLLPMVSAHATDSNAVNVTFSVKLTLNDLFHKEEEDAAKLDNGRIDEREPRLSPRVY